MLLTSSNLPFHINSHNAAVAQNPFLCCLRGCLKHSSREGQEGNVGTRQAGSLPPCYGLCTPPELCHARLPQHTRPACKLRAALHNGIQGSSTHHRVWEIHHWINLQKTDVSDAQGYQLLMPGEDLSTPVREGGLGINSAEDAQGLPWKVAVMQPSSERCKPSSHLLPLVKI